MSSMLQYVASQKEVKPANVSSFGSPYRILTENIIQGDLSYPSYFINILIFKVSCTTI